MSFCGLGSCIGLYMRVSGSLPRDSSVVNLGSAAMGPKKVEERLFNTSAPSDTNNPSDTSEPPACPVRANTNHGPGLPSRPPNEKFIIGNLKIIVETKEGVSSIQSIIKMTENGDEPVQIIKRLDNGTKFYLRDQKGYEAKLQMEKSKDGSIQWNLIPPSPVLFLELLRSNKCNVEVEQLSEPIEINGRKFEYRVKCEEARYAFQGGQTAVCTGSAVVHFDEKDGFVKPQCMLDGSGIEMEQTGKYFVITHSGTFEKSVLSKGKITTKNLHKNKITSSIEGKFVVKDNFYKLNGEGSVVMLPYKITGNFREGRLVIDGTQKVFKENEILQHIGSGSGSVLPKASDITNKLTFIDGGRSVVVTFDPETANYTWEISEK